MSTDTATSKPLIQIDDEIREMTDEEYAAYLERSSSETPLLNQDDE